MVKRLYPLAFLLLFFFHNSNAQTGCPGCSIDLPPLPEDTIFLGAAPDGVAGEFYDGDISFRMPKTTTPVNAQDPGTPAGLGISKITIVSLLNVPPGLSWEPNQVEFDPGNETDGCVKFCGTPLIPGFYEVEVFVTAEVSLITQSTSFSFPIYIAPSVSSTDGFAMTNASGCGEVTVDFSNNIPSNGLTGYSYDWDFGNGETSGEENPGAVTYSEPGIYEVNYEATIDTFGYQLTTVQVLEAGCDDVALPPIFSGAPDLYIKINDPDGNQVFSTNAITNSPLPSAWNVNLMLGPGDYTLEVRDDDTIGSDGCGTVTFNQNTSDTLVDGELVVFVSIIHPVFTVSSTDTVIVFENPAPPIVMPDDLVQICEGEEIDLLTDYSDNLQWYRDTTVLFGETLQFLTVSSSGNYWVEYTSPDGCKSQSEAVEVIVQGPPALPAFQVTGNLLAVLNPDLLPGDYSLQWSIDGQAIPGATDLEFCITEPGTALYSLTVVNNVTGCSNEFSLGAGYDSSYDCDMLLSSDEVRAIEQSLVVFPNPATDFLNVRFEGEDFSNIEISIVDAVGRTWKSNQFQASAGIFTEKIELNDLPAGVYLLQIRLEDGSVVRRFLKK